MNREVKQGWENPDELDSVNKYIFTHGKQTFNSKAEQFDEMKLDVM